MSEIRSGLRQMLATPSVYNFFQNLVGANSWRKNVISRSVSKNLTDSHIVIDIGCGTGEILDYLPPNTQYIGFDRNPKYIAHAKSRFLNKKEATFFCQDITDGFSIEQSQTAIVLAIGLIHHLDDTDVISLFETARKLIGISGFLLTLDPVYHPAQSPLARYIVSKDRGTAVRAVEQYKALADEQFSSVEVKLDMNPLHIPYTGIVMTCRA